MTMPKSALCPGTAKHWICSGAPGGLAPQDAAKVFEASLAIFGRQSSQPRPIDPVEQMEEMPALLGHQASRGPVPTRPGDAVLHRLRPGFRGEGSQLDCRGRGDASRIPEDRAAWRALLLMSVGRRAIAGFIPIHCTTSGSVAASNVSHPECSTGIRARLRMSADDPLDKAIDCQPIAVACRAPRIRLGPMMPF